MRLHSIDCSASEYNDLHCRWEQTEGMTIQKAEQP